MDHRKNNFDILRLLFATFVIISHSYTLAGLPECDFLCQITHRQVSFSNIGLWGFFTISGYLILQSLQRSQNLVAYFWKRFLRLFPALIVVLLLTTVFAAFVYEGSIPVLENKSLFTYLPSNLKLYEAQGSIDGVFENNPYKSAINGSLWTISLEFSMYVLLALLFFVRKRLRLVQIILLLSFFLFTAGRVLWPIQLSQSTLFFYPFRLAELGLFFLGGAFLAAINIEKSKIKTGLLVAISILMIASLLFDFYTLIRWFIVPVFVILLGLTPIPFLSDIGKKFGDISYGIYIYAFPVQQTLMYFFHLNYLQLMLCSICIAYLFGYLSWHLVEKRALKLKGIKAFSH